MKKLKRAFTIVELVIVIAVIAILAAVLIPTFTSLIEKANESSDTVLAKNMNTILSTTDYEEDKSDRMTDTLYLLNENGYSLENMNPTADGNVFVWDSAANRIVYLDKDGKVIYSENKAYTDVASMVANAKGYLWVTVGSMEDIEKWSALDLYFSSDIGGTDTTLELNDSSLDTSAFRFLGTVKYGAETKNVSVYGSVAEMVIDSPNATVTNYSRAGKVTIDAIGPHSYYENGSVDNLIVSESVGASNIVIEEKGMVQNISVQSGSASVVNKGYIKEIDEQSKTGTKVHNQGGVIETPNDFADGDLDSKREFVLSINSYKDLALFRDSVNNGTSYQGMTVQLTTDIDISGWAWLPIGAMYRGDVQNGTGINSVFQGTFDGGNHTINGLSNNGFSIVSVYKGKNDTTPGENSEVVYGFFGSIYNATIKNLKLSEVNIRISYDSGEKLMGDSIGALVGFAYGDVGTEGGVTIENCHVLSGVVEGYDAVAGILGRYYDSVSNDEEGQTVLIMRNCSNAADVTAVRRASGVLGFVNTPLQLYECSNSGDITSLDYGKDPVQGARSTNNLGEDIGPAYAYYRAAGVAGMDKIHVSTEDLATCSNTGTITGGQAPSTVAGEERDEGDHCVAEIVCAGKYYYNSSSDCNIED